MTQIEAAGQKAAALQLNTGAIQSFGDVLRCRLSTTLAERFSADHIDFLINNAGQGGYKPIPEVTEAFFDDLLNVHFKGVYFLTQQLLPLLNDGGGIVNISSGLTRTSMPGSSVYALSMKSAIETFCPLPSLEEVRVKMGILRQCRCPRRYYDGFWQWPPSKTTQSSKDPFSAITSLGRPGVAEDIGGVVAFLCTEDARWVNGQRIGEVSGGMNL